MPASRSLYDILNVAPGAELVVIEAAYRALMKKYHPDQAAAADGGPSAADINKAFAVLRDPERRAEYDQRERRHQQSIQLAQYHPPAPPRGHSRVFGWSGWTVALVMAGVVAVMTMRAEDIAATKAQAARAAAAVSEPDFRSQPSIPDVPLTPAASEIRAAAYAAEGAKARAAAAEAKAKAANPPIIDLDEPAPRASKRPAPRRQAQRKTRPAEEKDFLEREDYIY
jgi:curved DNA-binding protein CbpA